MADFYLDNDVSLRLAPLLRQGGHTAMAARDLALRRATDDAQLLTAVQSGRIMLTYNRRDFALLHDAWQSWPAAFGLALPPHLGILVLNPASPTTLARAIAAFLAVTPLAGCVNELFWWYGQGWRRRLVGTGWEQRSFQVDEDSL